MWLGNSTSCNKVAKAAIDAKPEPEAKLEDTSRTGWMANNVTSLYTTSWGHGRGADRVEVGGIYTCLQWAQAVSYRFDGLS